MSSLSPRIMLSKYLSTLWPCQVEHKITIIATVIDKVCWKRYLPGQCWMFLLYTWPRFLSYNNIGLKRYSFPLYHYHLSQQPSTVWIRAVLQEKAKKAGLKLSIQKTKIMASGPITLWQIDGGESGKSDRFYFVGLQTHCGWWLQPRNEKTLALWKKSYDKSSSILKNRDITLPAKVHIVKAVVFPVVMYRCESWTIKKAGHWRIEAFKLWCWRRPLRVPWTAGRSNRSILKEINADAEIEGCWILWPLDAKNWLIGKVSDYGKDWGQEEKRVTEDEMVR